MHTGVVKLQENGTMLVNEANSVGFEPFRRFFFSQLTQLISYVSLDILTLVMKISTWKRKPLSSLLANHFPFCLPMYFS